MIIKTDNLFINTDNIVTISHYEVNPSDTTKYSAGLDINGIRYPFYVGTTNGYPQDEVRWEINTNLMNYVKAIVNKMTNAGSLDQVVIEDIHFPDRLETYPEATKTSIPIPKREQIND